MIRDAFFPESSGGINLPCEIKNGIFSFRDWKRIFGASFPTESEVTDDLQSKSQCQIWSRRILYSNGKETIVFNHVSQPTKSTRWKPHGMERECEILHREGELTPPQNSVNNTYWLSIAFPMFEIMRPKMTTRTTTTVIKRSPQPIERNFSREAAFRQSLLELIELKVNRKVNFPSSRAAVVELDAPEE